MVLTVKSEHCEFSDLSIFNFLRKVQYSGKWHEPCCHAVNNYFEMTYGNRFLLKRLLKTHTMVIVQDLRPNLDIFLSFKRLFSFYWLLDIWPLVNWPLIFDRWTFDSYVISSDQMSRGQKSKWWNVLKIDLRYNIHGWNDREPFHPFMN